MLSSKLEGSSCNKFGEGGYMENNMPKFMSQKMLKHCPFITLDFDHYACTNSLVKESESQLPNRAETK